MIAITYDKNTNTVFGHFGEKYCVFKGVNTSFSLKMSCKLGIFSKKFMLNKWKILGFF